VRATRTGGLQVRADLRTHRKDVAVAIEVMGATSRVAAMSRLTWLLAATSLVAAACVDDSTHSEPGPVVGPVITPGSSDTKVRVNPTSGLGVSERGGTATFTVELTRQPTHDVTVHLYVDDESEGSIDVSTLLFTPTSYGPRTVTVTGIDDGDADGNQPFDVILGEAISRDLRYQSVEAADVHVTNVDDDSPGVTVLAADDLSTTEAGGTATFTVQLNTRPTGEVVIPLATSNHAEATLSASELRFYPRDWDVAQVVTITGVDDYYDDGDQPLTIAIGRAASSDVDYLALDPADLAVTNADDDNPGVVLPTGPLELLEGSYLYAEGFRLTMRPSNYAYVYVSARSADGSIYGDLYFDHYNWDVPQVMYIHGDNATVDGDRDVVLDITTTSHDPNYSNRDFGDLTVHVVDNDVPSLNIYGDNVATEGHGCAYTYVYLGTVPTAEVTVRVTSSDESQLTVQDSLLTFGPVSNGAYAYVCPVDDAVIDGEHTVSVTASIETSADPHYAEVAPATTSFVVSDNDIAVTVENTYGYYYIYPSTSAPFTVRLGAAPTHDVVVPVASSNPGLGVTDVPSLTFTPDNWSVPQTFTLTGHDNGYYDSYVYFTVSTGPTVSDDPVFAGHSSTFGLYGMN
jgi:hypothetical protein